jgi:endonuclease/exonuclease/phosphatase (EEP) superfamily protein YafD
MQTARSDASASSQHAGAAGRRRWRVGRGRSWPVAVLAWTVLLCGAVATAVYLAGRVLGDATGWLYVANMSMFLWLTPLVVLCVVGVALRSWPAVVACLVPVIAWVATFGPLFVPDLMTPAPAADLRVMTYNMHGDPDVPSVGNVVRQVEQADPDVLLLQEVAPFSRRRLLDRLSDDLEHHHFAEINPAAPAASGTAVFSQLPIRGTRPVTGLPDASRPMDIVVVEAPNGPLAVASLHLITPDDGCKSGEVSACVASLGQVGRDAAVRRVEIEQVAAALPDGPLVVGGDLNSGTANDPRRRLLDAGLVDLQRASGSGPGFTAERAGLPFRIDWLFASRDVTPVRAWVGPLDRSDHRPVIADVALR